MVQTECITDQQVMWLDAIHLHDLILAYPELHQGDLGKQGQHDRGRWDRCHPFVPWDLLRLATQVEADLPLDAAGD